MTKMAIVTLIQSSNREESEPSELVNEIREYLKSSGLSKAWSIENIAVLDDTSPTTETTRTTRPDDLTVR